MLRKKRSRCRIDGAMGVKTYVYLKNETAKRLNAAAAETSWKEQEIIQELIDYFLDTWLEGERAKLEKFRRMTGQFEGKTRNAPA